MDLDYLPQDLKNIVIDYKNQIEHQEKYSKCMNELLSLQRQIFYSHYFYRSSDLSFVSSINLVNSVLYIHDGVSNRMIFTEYTNKVMVRKI